MKYSFIKGCLASGLLLIGIPNAFAIVSCKVLKEPMMTIIDVPLDSANSILANITSDYSQWNYDFQAIQSLIEAYMWGLGRRATID